MEHAKLFPGIHMLPLGHGDLVRRDLAHAKRSKAHQADILVVSFDEDDSPCGHLSEVGL